MPKELRSYTQVLISVGEIRIETNYNNTNDVVTYRIIDGDDNWVEFPESRMTALISSLSLAFKESRP